jgi:hypothetical protein
MDADAAFTRLAERLQDNDPQSWEELFTRYAQRLTRLAGQHLGRRVAAREEGGRGVVRVSHLLPPQYEWGIPNRQLGRAVAVAGKNPGAEGPCQGPPPYGAAARRRCADPGDDALPVGIVSREPRPEQLTALEDEIEGLVRGLPDLHGKVLELLLQGCAVPEIASKLNVSRRDH